MLLVPLGIAAAGGAGFLALLARMGAGTYDPRAVVSPLIGRAMPEFSLPGLDGPGFGAADVRRAGHPVLLNFFASWCEPCQVEAPVLETLKQRGVDLWGIAYKDRDDATARFLDRTGDPFSRIAVDGTGRTAIDFGVYGVPETFLVDPSGVIRWRVAGALDAAAVETVTPILRRYG